MGLHLALGSLRVTSWRRGLVGRWLDTLAPPGDGDVRLGVQVGLGLDQATLRASGAPRAMTVRLRSALTALRAPRVAWTVLGELEEVMDVERAAAWLTLAQGQTACGWALSGRLGLDAVGDGLPDGALRRGLRAWADAPAAQWASEVTHGFDAQGSWSCLEVPAVGSSARGDVRVAMGLLARVGVALLDERVLAPFKVEGRGRLSVAAAFDANGLRRAGLVAREPGRALLVEVARALGTEQAPDALAAFEGVLGAEAPTALAVWHTPEGLRAEVRYLDA